jgi:hypothetical protein
LIELSDLPQDSKGKALMMMQQQAEAAQEAEKMKYETEVVKSLMGGGKKMPEAT